ncbi:zinc finger BED domain-containing protein RICESLEEPER 1-like [Lycium ferocissimum]|uniref:zinc finger BED domain-containing protein RICESLEEPER 1-like n=1 Tax=Lycium ferocissimum TaxID=112874 RepID=UPI0028164BB0|nr:zinc finger BED domain-containing protein RICESLEEPER 1-like [Lycium ferocissimum]XP_059275456.1 zinc finger BED domain-containing protein RICESLEEPER 1-like [Lycium ferocissimum]XP_059275457.1 zinc finger BED domain-containing protein RICESLEEPER 1-like [Lycium ferocissimum]
MTNTKRKKTLCDFFAGSDVPTKGKSHDCGPRNANLRDVGSSNLGKEHAIMEETAYRAMAKFFCQAGASPKSIENVHFKKFIAYLNPKFRPSSAILSRYCLELYEEDKAKVKETLQSLNGRVSLSVERLTYNKFNDFSYWPTSDFEETYFDFICLRVHFIDEDWKLRSWVISFRSFDAYDDYVGETIQCLLDFGIEDNICAVTVHSYLDIDETVDAIKSNLLEKKTLQLDGQLFRVSCCADMFSSLVNKAFGMIDDLISHIRLIVCWGRSLPVWNVTFLKLQEALELEAKGEYLKTDDYKGYDIPSPQEWEKVRGVCKLVGHVYNAAQVLFMAKRPTAGLYFHNLNKLRFNLMKDSASSDEFAGNLANSMLKKFGEYWRNMYLVLALATIMDPRYKVKYLEFCFLKYGGNDHSPLPSILEAIRSLFNDYVVDKSSMEYPLSDSGSDDSDTGEDLISDEFDTGEDLLEPVEVLDDPSFGFDCSDEFSKFIQTTSQPPKSELDCYLEEPIFPWTKNFDVLSWWKAASPRYPALSNLARDLLSIQLSHVTGYEAYYTEVREPDRSTTSMEADLVNALMSTKSWCDKQWRNAMKAEGSVAQNK